MKFLTTNKDEAMAKINQFIYWPKHFCNIEFCFGFIVILLNFGDLQRDDHRKALNNLAFLYWNSVLLFEFLQEVRRDLMKYSEAMSNKFYCSNFFVQLLEYIKYFLPLCSKSEIENVNPNSFICILWVAAQMSGNYKKAIELTEFFLTNDFKHTDLSSNKDLYIVCNCIIRVNEQGFNEHINAAAFTSFEELCKHNEGYIEHIVELMIDQSDSYTNCEVFSESCLQLWEFMKEKIPFFIEKAQRIVDNRRISFAFNCVKMKNIAFIKILLDSNILNASDFSSNVYISDSDLLECSEYDEFMYIDISEMKEEANALIIEF